MGLLFVGLDVIGDYLTEINVTSPTCVRELDALFGLNIADDLMEATADLMSVCRVRQVQIVEDLDPELNVLKSCGELRIAIQV